MKKLTFLLLAASAFGQINNPSAGGTFSGDTFFKSGRPWYDVMAFGAKADTQTATDASITNATAILTTTSSGKFASSDVGKTIIVRGAGAAGVDLITTIAGFTNANSVTLTANAGTTVGPTATAIFGTDDSAAFSSAYTACPSTGCHIFYPQGQYMQVSDISYSTSAKCPEVDGVASGDTTINYAGTGTAYTFNCTQSHIYGFGMSNMSIVGTGGATTLLLLGGTVGAEGFYSENLMLNNGTGTSLLFGNNVWAAHFNHLKAQVTTGGTSMSIPAGTTNTGESIEFTDSFFIGTGSAPSCVIVDATSGLSNVSFVGSSFDNCSFEQSGGGAFFTNSHFENPSNNVTNDFDVVNGGNQTHYGTSMLNDSTSANPSEFINMGASAGTVLLGACNFKSGFATLAKVVTVGGGTLREWGSVSGGNITAVATTSGSGVARTLSNFAGSNTVNGVVNLNTSNTAQLQLQDSNNTASTTNISSVASAGDTILGFDVTPQDSSHAATFRMFRTTNTSALRLFSILKGDNTNTNAFQVSAGTGKVSVYGITNTAGIGVVPVYGATSQKAETTSADANVLTYTPPATAGSYKVNVSISVASATTGVISYTVSWKDSNGNAQTNIAGPLFQYGTAAPNTTFTTSAAGNYGGVMPIDIDNSATAIIVKWVGGGTTSAKMSAWIEQGQ